MSNRILGGMAAFALILAFAAARPPTTDAGMLGLQPNISQDCTDRVELAVEAALAEFFAPDTYDLSHGACVAALASRNVTPLATDLCREPRVRDRLGARLRLSGPLNQGQCVQRLTPILEQLFRTVTLAGAFSCPVARVSPGPPADKAMVEFQDTGPGLLYLTVTEPKNVTVDIVPFPFAPEYTGVITVTATKGVQTQAASFTIAVRIDTDAFSTVRFCTTTF